MKIIIADRNAITRRTIKLLIKSQSSFRVIGEAKNQKKLIALLKTMQPNLILLDSELAGEDSLNLISTLHEIDNRPYVIIMSGDPEIEALALKAGAEAYYLKGTSVKGLLALIESLHSICINKDKRGYGN